MRLECAICGRERDEASCQVFTPTKEERLALQRMGEIPKDRYAYCRPCMRLMENPATAVALMKGVVQIHASAMGAVNAEELAVRFQNRLLAKTKIPGKKS